MGYFKELMSGQKLTRGGGKLQFAAGSIGGKAFLGGGPDTVTYGDYIGDRSSANVTIDGVEELIRVLDALPWKDIKVPVEKATLFAGRAIRKDMRSTIPIGKMRSSKILKSGKQSKAMVSGDTLTMAKKSIGSALRRYWKDGNVVLVVGPRRQFHARNGERIDKILLGIEKGWRGRKPKPFMQAAYNRGKYTVPGDFAKTIRPLLEAAATARARKEGAVATGLRG